mmetsp:Transcript_56705/g.112598  ORF Transcript_56705/g.112598 Transcript_56705/m.112598 type:complete len:210 (-) Transcript_56705:36-665(-)
MHRLHTPSTYTSSIHPRHSIHVTSMYPPYSQLPSALDLPSTEWHARSLQSITLGMMGLVLCSAAEVTLREGCPVQPIYNEWQITFAGSAMGLETFVQHLLAFPHQARWLITSTILIGVNMLLFNSPLNSPLGPWPPAVCLAMLTCTISIGEVAGYYQHRAMRIRFLRRHHRTKPPPALSPLTPPSPALPPPPPTPRLLHPVESSASESA